VHDLSARLGRCPTSTLCDAFLKSGLRRPERLVLAGLVRLVPDDTVVVGRARTMQMGVVRDPGRVATVANRTLAFDLVDNAQPGDFLVVAAPQALPYAIWGGSLSLQARLRGAVGVAVDGLTRDVSDIAQHGLPVWCSGVTPIPSGYAGYSCVATGLSVTCAGVEVVPGDYVVGDRDGVIVVPQDDAEQIAEVCEELVRREELAHSRMVEGSSMAEAYPSRAYYVQPGQSS